MLGEIRDIKFLCLSGTIFDQETRVHTFIKNPKFFLANWIFFNKKVCERVDEVDCAQSPQFYDLNLELFGRNGVIL